MEKIGASFAVFTITGAALIAYDGALVKVRSDERAASIASKRKQDALILRLDMACAEIDSLIGGRLPIFAFEEVGTKTKNEFKVDEYAIDMTSEFAEAFDNLDLLPRDCLHELRTLRTNVRDYAKGLSGFENSRDKSYFNFESNWHWLAKSSVTYLINIQQSARLIRAKLAPIVEKITPPMDDTERTYALYGEPIDD